CHSAGFISLFEVDKAAQGLAFVRPGVSRGSRPGESCLAGAGLAGSSVSGVGKAAWGVLPLMEIRSRAVHISTGLLPNSLHSHHQSWEHFLVSRSTDRR